MSLRQIGLRHDTRCYYNVRSKADMSQLNLGRDFNSVEFDLKIVSDATAFVHLFGCYILHKKKKK